MVLYPPAQISAATHAYSVLASPRALLAASGWLAQSSMIARSSSALAAADPFGHAAGAVSIRPRYRREAGDRCECNRGHGSAGSAHSLATGRPAAQD